MKKDLSRAKEILTRFLHELDEARDVRDQIIGPMEATAFSIKDRKPIFDMEQIPQKLSINDIEEESYRWIYFEAWQPRMLMQRPKPNPLPKYYHQLAAQLYHNWWKLKPNMIYRGKIIPKPDEKCSLIDYLKQLETAITDGCEARIVWILSLKSFLEYRRYNIPDKSMLGGLESIFPRGMDICDSYHVRKTQNGIEKVKRRTILRDPLMSASPIDIEKSAQIVKNLLMTVFKGRPNSQHSAAEALGFAWICNAVASAHITTEESTLFVLKTTDLLKHSHVDSDPWCKSRHHLRTPTENGLVEIPISKNLHDYLLALPRPHSNDQILTSLWRTLHRTLLKKGIGSSNAKSDSKPNNLSFLTLMSQPHHAIGHRCIISKSSS